MQNIDGKKQKICYFCSSACYKASYKHVGWYDGKAEARRSAREANRDPEKRAIAWKKYYKTHGEEIRKKRKERYYANKGLELADRIFYAKKRKSNVQSEDCETERNTIEQTR